MGRNGIQLGLTQVSMFPHIPARNIVKPRIEAPVRAEDRSLFVFGLLHPKGLDLLPAKILHIKVGTACHQILDLFHVPDTADLLIIGKHLGIHGHASFS